MLTTNLSCYILHSLPQPNSVFNEYGVDMIGAMQPVNTYVYEPNWAPNAQ